MISPGVPWCSAGNKIKVGKGAYIEDLSFSKLILGDNVVIGANAILRNTQIGYGVVIGAYSRIRHSDIGVGCKIGKNTTLGRVVLNHDVCVGKNTSIYGSSLGYRSEIGDGVIINSDCTIKQYCDIGDNVTIHPMCVIMAGVRIRNWSEIRWGCTLGERVAVGKRVYIDVPQISEDCVIGDNNTISCMFIGEGISIPAVKNTDRAREESRMSVGNFTCPTSRYTATYFVKNKVCYVQAGCSDVMTLDEFYQARKDRPERQTTILFLDALYKLCEMNKWKTGE